MRTFLALALMAVFSACGARKPVPVPKEYAPQDGDFLFQSLPHNALIDAIEGSTGSPFSHCGIVVKRDNDWKVIEAIGPVKETLLPLWIAQGRDNSFVACRLKAPLL